MNAYYAIGPIFLVFLTAAMISCLTPMHQAHANPEQGEGEPTSMPRISNGGVQAPAEQGWSTRPGRVGRDGTARQPPAQRQASAPEQGKSAPQPSPRAIEKPSESAEKSVDSPSPSPVAESADVKPAKSQAEIYRQEQEERRRRMELQQQQAEEAERIRREARIREMIQEQQEAIRQEEPQFQTPK